MKIFLDTNIVIYLARYNGYVMVGEPDQLLEHEDEGWQAEVSALKQLFDVHEVAGFRFATTPTIIEEMTHNPSPRWEREFLELLVEHTRDCIAEEEIQFTEELVQEVMRSLSPTFGKITNDCLALAEAIVLECDVFLTNDAKLARRVDPQGRIMIMRATGLLERWRDEDQL